MKNNIIYSESKVVFPPSITQEIYPFSIYGKLIRDSVSREVRVKLSDEVYRDIFDKFVPKLEEGSQYKPMDYYHIILITKEEIGQIPLFFAKDYILQVVKELRIELTQVEEIKPEGEPTIDSMLICRVDPGQLESFRLSCGLPERHSPFGFSFALAKKLKAKVKVAKPNAKLPVPPAIVTFMKRMADIFSGTPYIWGGWVRDTLDRIKPNDVDIVLIPQPSIPFIPRSNREELKEKILECYPKSQIIDLDTLVPGLFRLKIFGYSIDLVYKHDHYTLYDIFKSCDLLVNSLACDMKGSLLGTLNAYEAHRRHLLSFNPQRQMIGPNEILRQHRNFFSHLLKYEADSNSVRYILPETNSQQAYVSLNDENSGPVPSELRKHFVKTHEERCYYLDYWFDSNLFEIAFPSLKNLFKEMTVVQIDEFKYDVREKIKNLGSRDLVDFATLFFKTLYIRGNFKSPYVFIIILNDDPTFRRIFWERLDNFKKEIFAVHHQVNS